MINEEALRKLTEMKADTTAEAYREQMRSTDFQGVTFKD